MVKKPLKKEQPRKSRQLLIQRTKEFVEFMDTIKVDQGIPREFNAHVPHPEDVVRLAEMFERSGLDINAPGHWQSLLCTMANFFLDAPPTREVTDWTESGKNLFLRHLLAIKEKNPTCGQEKLCELLKERMPREYPADSKSLRTQLQNILREKKLRLNSGGAFEEDRTFLQAFGVKLAAVGDVANNLQPR